jgi:hypothetical protein
MNKDSCANVQLEVSFQPGGFMAEIANQNGGNNAVKGIISLCVLVGGAWFFFGGGLEQQASHDMSNIEKKVATDAVEEYRIAERSGTQIDRCVHAGLVAAAYIQAKDEENYRVWKRTERTDCDAAGVPAQ